tara:strand:+ start:6466 stop:7863 length:1398 start_codon:yes stop_codon:yes gene_type:complete
MYSTGLYIFRRDLRIDKNNAFYNAIKMCDKIIPIFIFTPEQIKNNTYKSDKAVQFMIESIDDLHIQLDKNLNTFYGDYEDIIKKLIKKYKIECIFLNKDYTPYSKKRDKNIEDICESSGIDFKSFHDICLMNPGIILTKSDCDVYEKFTPFYDRCLKNLDKIENISSLPNNYKKKIKSKIKDNTFTIDIKDAYIKYTIPNYSSLLVGGRENALKILKTLDEFKDYDKTRDNLNKETTQLSAYLKFGCISVKEVYHYLIKKGFKKSHALIRQLFWRDFYIHILNEHGRVLKGEPFKEKYKALEWDNNNTLFQYWKDGKTGFPIIDANMRMLNEVGYMHNRGRLIVASFLIKILFIDWRKGEKYFATKLIDYDPAANNGNWQWVAGTGVDSQPYFRIFNPWSQSKKHDINAEFIKKWCPELKDVPAKDIHKWNDECEKYLKNGVQYKKPIVDYSERREYVLKKYKKI